VTSWIVCLYTALKIKIEDDNRSTSYQQSPRLHFGALAPMKIDYKENDVPVYL
jgi:hypothetical protein